MSADPVAPPVTQPTGEITSAWSEGSTHVFTRLARTSLFLESLQEECLAPLGISFGDYAVLRMLYYEGPDATLSPTRLAEVLVRTTGGMTKIVDRLEAQGTVTREPDPNDRRGILIRLTPAGRDLCHRASDAYTVVRRRLLDHLSETEISSIDASLGRLLEVFEVDRANVES